ncbi:MAG: hypothetical protein EA383_16255 [Spirochaetaceae bacterium]|nr:MAG: hypothetical protein EA383_16255 [Spirochaetaceae bacterium]
MVPVDVPMAPATRLGMNQITSGVFESSYGTYEGYRAKEYVVDVQDGRMYQIDMFAEFDAYLIVYMPDGVRFENDDGGSGTNALLRVIPYGDGPMRILARGYRRTPTGEFAVSVRDVTQ